MVENTVAVGGNFGHVKRMERVMSLQKPQEGKYAIDDTPVREGGDHNAFFTVEGDRADRETFFAESGKGIVTRQPGDDGGGGGRTHDQAAVVELRRFAVDFARGGA